MKGTALTLGAVAALAWAGVVASRRGSLNIPSDASPLQKRLLYVLQTYPETSAIRALELVAGLSGVLDRAVGSGTRSMYLYPTGVRQLKRDFVEMNERNRQDVLREGGKDPLGNYGWGGSRQVQERWSLAVGEDLRVAEVRRGRSAWIPVGEAPARVREFLNLDAHDRVEGFGSLAELREKAHGLRWGRTRGGFARAHFVLSVERPRSDVAVRADRVRAAKRQIAEIAKHRAEGADAG